jgi:crotonobetainyl-CoA:carnitine CoA-transferase CaiB-like acyl-CoA transferase
MHYIFYEMRTAGMSATTAAARGKDAEPRLGAMLGSTGPGMLAGMRVVEIADELGEMTGLLLAGMGADVVKVEPPQGSPTRRIGPFLDDLEHPERSLHFWHYNRAKRSVVCDLETGEGRARLEKLIAGADILLDSTSGQLEALPGLARNELMARYPALIVARMTPFGDTGPWSAWKGSDLIHLALGGVMMNCGYDPDPEGHYDLPPIAPQLWHAYHIAGEQLAVGIVAALLHRNRTGEGQDVSCAVHEAVAKNTELDLMSWVMLHQPLWRLTSRHAKEEPNHTPSIAHTKDGRWYIAWSLGARDKASLVPFLRQYGMEGSLPDPDTGVDPAVDQQARSIPGSGATDAEAARVGDAVQRFVRAYRYDTMPWREAQQAGLLWSPMRKPHENAEDEHWLTRESFADVEHPELGRSFRYATSKWLSTETSWQVGRRAPLIGEDTDEVLAQWAPVQAPVAAAPKAAPSRKSARGLPFALQGVRILDFSWFLASAGGTKFLAALGAESLKVEWKGNPDTRLAAMAPVGGREARAAATGPIKGVSDPDMGGQFNNKNSGKRGLSLNIRDPRGLEIAKALVAQSDIVAEGFSPGVLERLGLGYDVLRSIKPDIIYIQQSGMGSHGTYGRFRTVGPVAAAFAGISEMSGLPEPAMPAGWGYSYLDWTGAYGYALALLGALHHRDRTGRGQWIDASQCESGLFMTGVPVLDWSANGRVWSRIGNRSPYKPAAPHGAYRCRGEDRWIAIACFGEDEWRALCEVSRRSEWLGDPRFRTLADRLENQDALDAAVTDWTVGQDAFDLMQALQAAGVPAGVCQTAEDRCERDPQLAELEWLTEVTGTKIGTWPVAELPMKLSRTPAHVGGIPNRGAPGYGEDNHAILSELLGLSSEDVDGLARDGVI